MKLKINKEFKDKFTGEKYKAGSEVEFKDERAKELLSDTRELVSEVKETSEEASEEAPKKPAKKSKK